MKRSGDVTASAVILFCGSGLVILTALLMLLAFKTALLPPEQRAVEWTMPIFYALVAAWGIATGIGILQLRPWARISIIVMSAMAIFVAVCGGLGLMLVPFLLKQTPDVPPAVIKVIVVVWIVALLIPLAIAIWWLVLFTRARVRLEFATRGAAAVSSAIQGAGIAPDLAPTFAPAPSTPQIPTSVLVIAIVFLAGGGFALLGLPFTIRSNMPNMFLGILIRGWTAWTYLTVFALLQIGLSIAVLKRGAWALDALIAFLLFTAANWTLFTISPSRKAFFDTIMRQQTFPPGVNADAMTSFMNTVLPISMAFGLLLVVVMLYFLFTRRKAYRAACDARREVA